MKYSKAQIVATIGPPSESPEVLRAIIKHQVDVVRLNFSWGNTELRTKQIALVREIEKELNKKIPIIVDLPGPRVQEKDGHTYDQQASSSLTERDRGFIEFAVKQNVDYIAISFVGGAKDVEDCRKEISKFSGTQKIIAKIERKIALENIDQIIEKADAIMVARGDLGNEIPLEMIPFVQEKIIRKSKEKNKPVITATQMLLSMEENKTPTRAEVTDVANAILQGSDAVMLSEETAKGKNPIEAVEMMEKIVMEAERHMGKTLQINPL